MIVVVVIIVVGLAAVWVVSRVRRSHTPGGQIERSRKWRRSSGPG
jgi:hypothetical protein